MSMCIRRLTAEAAQRVLHDDDDLVEKENEFEGLVVCEFDKDRKYFDCEGM